MAKYKILMDNQKSSFHNTPKFLITIFRKYMAGYIIKKNIDRTTFLAVTINWETYFWKKNWCSSCWSKFKCIKKFMFMHEIYI